MNYKSGWLTLNRACNLRCKWCYAQSTEYLKEDDLDISLAYQLINIFSELNIRHIVLIGGEPTIYPHLFEVIDYCHKMNIRCGIVTNGLKCAEIDFIKKLKTHDVHSISLSLKGENKEAFQDVTGVNAFDKVKEAVRLLSFGRDKGECLYGTDREQYRLLFRRYSTNESIGREKISAII